MSKLRWQSYPSWIGETKQIRSSFQNCFMVVILEVEIIFSYGIVNVLLFPTSMVVLLSFLFSPTKVLCYLRAPFAVVFIGSTLFALQQLSGINAVFYFSSAVFKRVGVPSTLANIFIGISNLTGIVLINLLPLLDHFNLSLDL